MILWDLPSGNLRELWKMNMLIMGKLTIVMAIFNSYVTNYQGVKKWDWFLFFSLSLFGLTGFHERFICSR